METINLQADLIVMLRVLLLFLGAIIGWERERDGISAGIRPLGQFP